MIQFFESIQQAPKPLPPDSLVCADCSEALKHIGDNTIDAIATDPPSGIGFMGAEWDKDKGGRDHWIAWMQGVATECLRVLKPGGHALVWALPRTSHWTATAWENAGFQIREVIAYVFGSGFPKSHNIGKSVSKIMGEQREVVGNYIAPDGAERTRGTVQNTYGHGLSVGVKDKITKGTSEWEGWGTALKPAREDWILMRKPLQKGLTVAENCLKWGTGGIQIDECRVRYESGGSIASNPLLRKDSGAKINYGKDTNPSSYSLKNESGQMNINAHGRFPANLILDGSQYVMDLFPNSKSTGGTNPAKQNQIYGKRDSVEFFNYGDSGSAARFFQHCPTSPQDTHAQSLLYCPKPSKKERNKGCEDMLGNNHPTLKPIALMEYLVKLVSRENAVVLDPFAGSGTTPIAALNTNRRFIAIEQNAHYAIIALNRIIAHHNTT
jgi:DNA modification methylase